MLFKQKKKKTKMMLVFKQKEKKRKHLFIKEIFEKILCNKEKRKGK